MTKNKNISFVWYPLGSSEPVENFSPFDDPAVKALLNQMLTQMIQDFEDSEDYADYVLPSLAEQQDVEMQLDTLDRLDCLVDDEILEDHPPTLALIMAAYHNYQPK